jgi:predicted AlkP superfamily pyrophosphatase or phosphodiesterase
MTLKLSHTIFAAAALAAAFQSHAAAPTAAPAQPKLVVVLVVDGLPNEQVLRYRDQFGQGGFRRLLEQGAWFSNAHQAHGITVTAVGHAAVLSGAYPYQHGVIANNWIDAATGEQVYCTDDASYSYIGEETKRLDGTSPARLRVSTLGDELRYASGNRAKVVTVSGKDRGAILLAGKTGTAYMYMDKTGNFASSTYYMAQHPEWVQRYQAGKPQNRYYGKNWNLLLPESAYANDMPDPAPVAGGARNGFPFSYYSESGELDSGYYARLRTGPYLDELTLEFARAAVEGEDLGRNAAGVPDLLGVSLSSHDYVNHAYGPESRMSHDHLQRLDRMLAGFFSYLDKRIGMDNVMVVLTADHGFSNTAEFSQGRRVDAQRIDGNKLMQGLDAQLAKVFGVEKLVVGSAKGNVLPNIYLDHGLMEQNKLKPDDVEKAAAAWLEAQPGVSEVYRRQQLESGGANGTRQSLLMRRAFNRQASGDLILVHKAFWYVGSGTSGTTHGSPYAYDTNVPLMVMGKQWIKPGAYGQYAEVVDIAPTLAHLLRVRPPAGAEGRVLTETLR